MERIRLPASRWQQIGISLLLLAWLGLACRIKWGEAGFCLWLGSFCAASPDAGHTWPQALIDAALNGYVVFWSVYLVLWYAVMLWRDDLESCFIGVGIDLKRESWMNIVQRVILLAAAITILWMIFSTNFNGPGRPMDPYTGFFRLAGLFLAALLAWNAFRSTRP